MQYAVKIVVAHFGSSSKNKNIHPEKKFLIFQGMEHFCSNVKQFLIFQETEALKKTPYIFIK